MRDMGSPVPLLPMRYRRNFTTNHALTIWTGQAEPVALPATSVRAKGRIPPAPRPAILQATTVPFWDWAPSGRLPADRLSWRR